MSASPPTLRSLAISTPSLNVAAPVTSRVPVMSASPLTVRLPLNEPFAPLISPVTVRLPVMSASPPISSPPVAVISPLTVMSSSNSAPP